MAKHHAGAYNKGWKARINYRPRNRCPYNPSSIAVAGRGRHVPTGARAYAKAWLKGWDDADKFKTGD